MPRLFCENDGLKYIMECKELEKKEKQFPPSFNNEVSFAQIYYNIEKKLNDEVHCHVVAGAATQGDGMLNDHGVGHIAMVLERATNILGDKAYDLSGYEIFFLMLSIHFHDVGNVLGRDQHEEKIEDVYKALGESLPLDSASKRLIRDIATSHGGVINGSKDTISYLEEETFINGLKIRPALLASILRFADEIADDKNRASQFLKNVGAIPPENEIFHLYSLSLEPPVINGDTLQLCYYIDNDCAYNKKNKNNEEVYLYDEILKRIQKCFCELDYCKKYSQGFISLSSISVKISVLKDDGLNIKYDVPPFKLRISGYPNIADYNPLVCSANKELIISDASKLIEILERS